MGLFERFLSLWVALAIVLGVVLGVWFPNVFACGDTDLADDLSDDDSD